jgi:hypothetical protein
MAFVDGRGSQLGSQCCARLLLGWLPDPISAVPQASATDENEIISCLICEHFVFCLA